MSDYSNLDYLKAVESSKKRAKVKETVMQELEANKAYQYANEETKRKMRAAAFSQKLREG